MGLFYATPDRGVSIKTGTIKFDITESGLTQMYHYATLPIAYDRVIGIHMTRSIVRCSKASNCIANLSCVKKGTQLPNGESASSDTIIVDVQAKNLSDNSTVSIYYAIVYWS